MPSSNYAKGFTLVELSIVLIIVGLLSASILVGRTLIHASEIRKQITQIEQFNVATNTFKNKYLCLPGDCANASALFPGAADGNGDGYITDCNGDIEGSVSYYDMGAFNNPESQAFWTQLGLSQLIGGNYDGIFVPTDNSVGNTYPKSVLNEKVGIFAYANTCGSHGGGYNAFSTIEVSEVGGLQNAVYNNTFHPLDAHDIDQKTDDGYPGSGKVSATHTQGFNLFPFDEDLSMAPALPLTPDRYCVYVPAAENRWVYNLLDGNAPCTMRFRASF